MTRAMATPAGIRAFWDERARQFKGDGRATLRETHLREVEVRAIESKIRSLCPRSVLDVGCGNGWSTRRYARRFPGVRFVGVDFSAEMIRYARLDVPPNCSFAEADVLDPGSLPAGPFDLVITQRCIQNLPDWDTQKRAVRNLLSRRAPGAAVLMMECSKNGVKQLNGARRRLGLAPIEGIEPWHNAFLRDELVVEEFDANVEYFSSTYMFLAKVVHKKLSYVARYLPPLGRFGYNRLYVLK